MRTFQVSRVSRHTPSVEIALKHCSTLDIIWGSDVVTVFVVEGKLIAGGRVGSGEVPIFRNICKCFRADTGPETVSIRVMPG